MINARLAKYPRKVMSWWQTVKPVFTKDSLLINNFQVMQRWEDGYMKSLAAIATSKGGYILEVGFGMGISAGYIQKSPKIKTHTIIECHPDIIASAKNKFSNELKSGRMKLLNGFWEDVVPTLADKSFDGILFDSCPLDSGIEFFQFFPFFSEAYRLLKDDGIFTYFSDEAIEISEDHLELLKKVGFKSINFKICAVRPPKTCEYWKYNTIVSPIVKKS